MSNRKRRGRGEGGIRYREDKGLWVSEVRLPNGKRKTVYGKTKQEVQEKLVKIQHDVSQGVDVDAERLTLGAWLTRWLADTKPTVDPNTDGPYERHVRLHITPLLGCVPLGKLRRGDVIRLYSDLAARGVSPAMQRKVGTTLTIALNKAVDHELLRSNPATRVKKPKAEKPEMQVLDPDQVGAFLREASADRRHALYVRALDSDARPGELFALLWSDVDFDRAFISITKSLEDINGRLRVKDVKTRKSRRRVDLSRHTLDALAEHRKRALAEGHYGADLPVFCDTEGGYLRLSNLHKHSFKPILQQAGLPAIRLYDLRHTCATLLLLADQPAKVVSERIGHSTVTLTLDTYSHVLPTMQRRAADVMGQILGTTPWAKAE